MKLKSIAVAVVAGVSVVLSSCVVDPGGYNSFSYSTNGYGSTVAWTNASYDANGFPIYGYSYGRPVYGYTAAGAAIFTIAALTALCYVPNWGPAPWYHGHWHYPHHIHRCAVPPRYAHGHAPHRRPAGGMHAPIHKNPGAVMGKPHGGHHGGRPNVGGHPSGGRPNVGGRPSGGRPNMGGQPSGGRPNVGGRPSGGRPSMGGQPSGGRPNVGARPSGGRPSAGSRPSGGGRSFSGGRSRGHSGGGRRR